jgi:hypothetical protein
MRQQLVGLHAHPVTPTALRVARAPGWAEFVNVTLLGKTERCDLAANQPAELQFSIERAKGIEPS